MTEPLVDVPVYPVLRLELRQDCDQWVAFLNGVAVGRGRGEEGKGCAQEVLVTAAAVVASQRPGGAIRARLGSGFEPGEAGVVTAAGQLIVQEDAPVGERRKPRRVLLLGAVAVVTAGVSVAGVAVVHSTRPFVGTARIVVASPAPVAVQLPVLAPVGWSSVAVWSLPLSSQSVTAGISTDSRLVFAPSSAGTAVVAVDAGSGVQRWSTPVGQVVGGPTLILVGRGSPVVEVWTNDHLVTLDPATGAERGSWELDAAWGQVAVVGGGLVVTGQSLHAQVFDGSALVSRVVPAGGSVAGVHAGGLVVAGHGAGTGAAWLVTSASVAGEGAALQAPAGTTWTGAVGVVGDRLVCAFSGVGGSGTVLRAFEVGTWTPSWTTGPLGGGDGVSWGATGVSSSLSSLVAVAPDQSWGIVARTVIDFRTGVTHALPSDWTTSTVGRTVGFGVTGGRVVSVTPEGDVTGAGGPATWTATGGSSVGPVAVTDAGQALIVATDGATRSVYAVRPRPQSHPGHPGDPGDR